MRLSRADIEEMVKEGCLSGELLFADGWDDAIVGVHRRAFDHHSCVVYSRDKIIESLVSQGCDLSEAEEFFEFNIVGAYVGKHTPIYIHTSA